MQRLKFWRWRWRAFSWRPYLGGLVTGLLLFSVLSVLVVSPWLLTHRSKLPLEAAFGNFAVSMAARLHAGGTSNPLTADRQTLQRGQYAFTGSCAQCHGPAGDARGGALARALFPPATDLTSSDARAKSDAELFWITKNGLSFTAMPAFGDQYNDEAIWAIVAYIRSLQGKGPKAAAAPAVPTPTGDELAKASVSGDAVARGAAVYFSQNCQLCHGGSGNGPRDLGLRLPPASQANDAFIGCMIRNGPNGMPAHPPGQISDEDLASLIAFLHTFPSEAPRRDGPPPGGTGAGPQSGATPAAGQGSRPGGGLPPEDDQRYSSPPGSDTSACIPPGLDGR